LGVNNIRLSTISWGLPSPKIRFSSYYYHFSWCLYSRCFVKVRWQIMVQIPDYLSVLAKRLPRSRWLCGNTANGW